VSNDTLRLEADERPSPALSFGIAAQFATLTITSVVLPPVILVTLGGGSEAYLAWAVVIAVFVSGITTIVQGLRVGRVGAGYILIMGSTPAYLSVCVGALDAGGPALLATLIVASSLVQFILGWKMAALSKVFTPTVAGTVLLLIPVSLAPVIVRKMGDVPQFADPAAAPITAGAALLTIVFLALRFDGALRLWSLGIGLAVGCLVGHWFGIFDVDRIVEAPWFGYPDPNGWPGLDLSFGPLFWALLPGFVMVTLVGAMDTLGDSIAIQRASWRTPRAIDYRAVQGAINADGLGNLLSGFGGTVPNTTYGSSVSIAEITGVAARTIGVWVGGIFVALAFLPKLLAVIVAIPGPVAGAYLVVVIGLLGMFGIRILVADGLDYRKSLLVGVGFWVGLACQFDLLFPAYMTGFVGDLLGNGMTAGGVTVVLLSTALSLTQPRPRRLRVALDSDAIVAVDNHLTAFAANTGASEEMTYRLRAIGEEAMHTLLLNGAKRSLLVVARVDGKATTLEFVASAGDQNLEDLAAMTDVAELPIESGASLRLLLHYATSLDHRQYHDLDVVTVRVE
jgi:NCS2 family nucleobase:cation symporter-2/xanthine permease XanP